MSLLWSFIVFLLFVSTTIEMSPLRGLKSKNNSSRGVACKTNYIKIYILCKAVNNDESNVPYPNI
jgi:hypothetical protein